jgi:hypothetical protein
MWFLRERRERGIRREIGIGIELDEAPFLIVLSFESFGNSVLSESLISLSQIVQGKFQVLVSMSLNSSFPLMGSPRRRFGCRSMACYIGLPMLFKKKKKI